MIRLIAMGLFVASGWLAYSDPSLAIMCLGGSFGLTMVRLDRW